MMRLRTLSLLVLVTLLVSAVPGSAQSNQPIIGFVVDREVQAKSVADNGPDGTSTLGAIFRSLGARTQVIRLSEPIPDEISVVVLAGPRRALSSAHLARLWVHMAKGKHVLFAIDPNGLNSVGSENSRGGLSTLLNLDYGIKIEDTFLAEPWYTTDTVQSIETTFQLAQADDFVADAITAPLITFNVPVMMWGARSVRVEPFGMESWATPLLQTSTPYGETRLPYIIRGQEPIELNLHQDLLGRLTVGAIAEHTANGSRVAVLGDSEMLQNGYGLADKTGTNSPLYPGNRLLAERIAAWLLDLPAESWPSPPQGVTWLAIDGNAADWGSTQATVVNDGEEQLPLAQDIRRIHTLRNTDYLYVIVETAAKPSPDSQLEIGLDLTLNSETDVSVTAQVQRILLTKAEISSVVTDGMMQIDSAIEIKIPLRIAGSGAGFRINSLCLVTKQEPVDCLDRGFAVSAVAEREPFEIHFPGTTMMTRVTGSSANLRTGPDTSYSVTGVVSYGEVFEVIGRNEDGTWLHVRNARYSGWIAGFLASTNGDVKTLPLTPVIPGDGNF